MSSSYFSQMGEDQYVDTEVFFGKTHGVFVDIGAHDGKTFSNTYFLEKFRHWSGICIEPLPEMYAKLQETRSSVNINACVSTKKGKLPFLKVSGVDNAEMFSGLTSSMDERQLEHIKKEVKRRHGTLKTVHVNTLPLSEILKKNSITHIDYCSIDTEGNELDVLRSIDFTACTITCFSVEDLYGNSELRKFLQDKGYTLVKELDKDLIFVKEQQKVKPKKSTLPATLSVVIHTKNEEKHISDCIASVKAIADEIIVMDMESQDNTVKLAKKAGAIVHAVKDVKFADPARNEGLSKAKSDWILVLDADERLQKPLLDMIRKILREDLYDVARLPRKNILLGKWIKHGLRWPDYQTRLFRNGFVHWTDTIHMAAQHTGRLLTLPATPRNSILHLHSSSVSHLLDKTILQASLERFYDDQKIIDLELIHHRMDQEFPWRFYEHEGYKDGLHGLIVNKFMQVYRFLEFAFYWERSGYKDIGSIRELESMWNTEAELARVKEELKVIKDSKFFIFWKLYTKMKRFIRPFASR